MGLVVCIEASVLMFPISVTMWLCAARQNQTSSVIYGEQALADRISRVVGELSDKCQTMMGRMLSLFSLVCAKSKHVASIREAKYLRRWALRHIHRSAQRFLRPEGCLPW